MAFQKLLSKCFPYSFKTNMLFELAIVSKAVRSPVVPHESSDHRGFFRRFFLLRQTVYHSAPAKLPEFPTLPIRQDLPEAPKDINNSANFAHVTVPITSNAVCGGGMCFKDMKIMRIIKMEKVKMKLRNVNAYSIQYSEFLQICVETCENPDEGAEIAKLLDDSANVIVLGNSILLRPKQVLTSVSVSGRHSSVSVSGRHSLLMFSL
ncbi:hypothetical protein VNO80_02247 [Phaseolus coccineus]|uniref:Calcium uniporter protein n=1 Tax=Phaseolus coccineus TaxID=3886 RepID=A0AAN9NPC1_PHACN